MVPQRLSVLSGSDYTSGGEQLIMWVTVVYLKPIYYRISTIYQ